MVEIKRKEKAKVVANRVKQSGQNRNKSIECRD